MKKYVIALLSMLLMGSLIFSACSLLGFGIGAGIDSSRRKPVAGWETYNIPMNEPITLYLRDRAPVKGRYKGAAKANPAVDTTFTVLLVETAPNKITDIPIANIDRMAIGSNLNSGKIMGFVLGLSVDAVMLISVLNKTGDQVEKGMANAMFGSSCPLVYSYDGSSYQQDAELFGGAIFKAAERPDWDNLDFLRETDDGLYRLKMTNVFDETQEVDFVKLLVIDHPRGSRVYPSFQGKLYALTNPQAPRKAHTFSGLDVRDDLRRTDEAYWLSNPLNRDLNNPEDLRDGVVLEFDRPDQASAAALLLNVQNTLWGSVLQKEMLKLPGRNLPQWYETLNHSEQAREELVGAMIREGMLKVSVWGNFGWRPAGHIWSVGSSVAKDIVLELNLDGIQGDKLRLKLEGPPGVCMLNSARVDFSFFHVPLGVQELDLYQASDQNGSDISLALLKADDLYYSMPTARDEAFLEFKAPPKKPGTHRSFMLKSGGYYTIHMPAEGEPQPERMQEMLTVPGAFTRYGLSLLYEQMSEVAQPGRIVL